MHQILRLVRCYNSKFGLFSLSNTIHSKHATIIGLSRNMSIINSRSFSQDNKKINENANEQKTTKKESKFKIFYKQYGPSFIVIHLMTVVGWLYVFFQFSKMGYDVTQLLVLLEKVNIISADTIESVNTKINNYEPERLKGWITGADIKHFVTAYMVYKVIAPFRYMISVALTRVIVLRLRKWGLFK